MRFNKSFLIQAGVMCLLVFTSFPAFSEIEGTKGALEESGAYDTADNAGNGENMGTDQSHMKDVRYVRDFIVITLRAGMGDEYKVLKTLETDTKLEVLKEGADFLRVRTVTGEEGWVRSRYITKDVPKLIVIKGLKKEVEKLQQDIDGLRKELAESNRQRDMEIEQSDNLARGIQKELKGKENKITALEKEIGQVKNQYNKLLKSASNVAELVNELDDNKEKNIALRNKIKELEDTNQNLQRENNDLASLRLLKWFLLGSGVLLVGFILGRIVKRKEYY